MEELQIPTTERIEQTDEQIALDNFLKEYESSFSDKKLCSAVEALIFATDEPLVAEDVVQFLRGSSFHVPPEDTDSSLLRTFVETIVELLNQDFIHTGRTFHITRLAGGYQFATTAEHGEIVARLARSKEKRRFSRAALESLAIVAYRQPITKPEVELIRGVNSNEVMNRLLEQGMITIAGRSETHGKPLLYKTTDEFLQAFGLDELANLPKPRELEELMEEKEAIIAKKAHTLVVSDAETAEKIREEFGSVGTVEPSPEIHSSSNATEASTNNLHDTAE